MWSGGEAGQSVWVTQDGWGWVGMGGDGLCPGGGLTGDLFHLTGTGQ